MIIDSSAIVAILRAEADAERLALAMEQATTPLRMSAANLLALAAIPATTARAGVEATRVPGRLDGPASGCCLPARAR